MNALLFFASGSLKKRTEKVLRRLKSNVAVLSVHVLYTDSLGVLLGWRHHRNLRATVAAAFATFLVRPPRDNTLTFFSNHCFLFLYLLNKSLCRFTPHQHLNVLNKQDARRQESSTGRFGFGRRNAGRRANSKRSSRPIQDGWKHVRASSIRQASGSESNFDICFSGASRHSVFDFARLGPGRVHSQPGASLTRLSSFL